MAKHERSRYELIAIGFEKVGIRLFRLEDGVVNQRPADQYGFVLGENREDAGKLVYIETKEVYKKKECQVFTKQVFESLSDNQQLCLYVAAKNKCHVLIAVYCQEDSCLYLWKLEGSFKTIGNLPYKICAEKKTGGSGVDKYSFFDIKLEELQEIGMCVPKEDTETLWEKL